MKSTEQDLRNYFTGQFADLSSSLNGGQTPEVKKIRKEAIRYFGELGFPGGKAEEYKYTPITRELLKAGIQPKNPSEPGLVPPFNEHLLPGLEGYILVFWNGRLVFKSEDSTEYLQVTSIDPNDTEQQDLLNNYLGKLSHYTEDAFAALNTALFNHGALITVQKGAEIDQPVIIYNLSDATDGTTYSQVRHLIVAEPGAKANLIEITENLSPEIQSFQNIASEIYLKENASLEINKVQVKCEGGIVVDNTDIHQSAGSKLLCNTITANGTIIRNNLNIAIDGPDCEAHMNGLYLVQNRDHIDNHTLVDHQVANSYSNELYKGIIDDQATGVFNGKIYVQPDAQKTNAFQSNKNILLSDQANMNTKPQLEIWADDVKCSHGATTGQIDPEQVFYLRSRGLDEKQAKGLLLYAFATEFLEQVSSETLSEYLEKVISDRLYNKS